MVRTRRDASYIVLKNSHWASSISDEPEAPIHFCNRASAASATDRSLTSIACRKTIGSSTLRSVTSSSNSFRFNGLTLTPFLGSYRRKPSASNRRTASRTGVWDTPSLNATRSITNEFSLYCPVSISLRSKSVQASAVDRISNGALGSIELFSCRGFRSSYPAVDNDKTAKLVAQRGSWVCWASLRPPARTDDLPRGASIWRLTLASRPPLAMPCTPSPDARRPMPLSKQSGRPWIRDNRVVHPLTTIL